MLDTTILDQEVEVEGQRYTYRQLVYIDPDNVLYALTTQAARFAYFGIRAAHAEALYQEAEADTKRKYAEIEIEARIKLPDDEDVKNGKLKMTEGLIKSYVLGDKEYIEALAKENQALRNWKMLRALTEAYVQRANMLQSFEATKRKEFDITDQALVATKTKLQSRNDGN